MASTEEVLSFHESENEALEGSPVAQGDTNVKMSNVCVRFNSLYAWILTIIQELTATKSNTNLRKSKGSMTRLSGSNSSISKTRKIENLTIWGRIK